MAPLPSEELPKVALEMAAVILILARGVSEEKAIVVTKLAYDATRGQERSQGLVHMFADDLELNCALEIRAMLDTGHSPLSIARATRDILLETRGRVPLWTRIKVWFWTKWVLRKERKKERDGTL